MPRDPDLFWELASIDYPIVDADAHVNEPPELWQERVPARLRPRAPRVERTDRGDAWIFDDGKLTMHLGLTAMAGRSFLEYQNQGLRYQDIRPGSFEPKARLRDLDADGIHAQVLYPSVTLGGARIYSDEPELQRACVRAYNEWMLEFCAAGGGRLVPQGIVPSCDADSAIAELEWILRSDHRGAIISAFPNGSLEYRPEDDAFFARAEEAGLPVAIHIGSFSAGAGSGGNFRSAEWNSLAFIGAAIGPRCGGGVIETTLSLIFSGLFERFPRLRLLLVESNLCWAAGLLEQSDDMFLRYRWFTGAVDEMQTRPSRIFHRNFWLTFMQDAAGLEMRHHLNPDQILFSTDYPHSATDWPNTQKVIDRLFRGLPKTEVRKMLRDNAVALYGLDEVPETLAER